MTTGRSEAAGVGGGVGATTALARISGRAREVRLDDPDSFVDGVPHEWFRMLRREAPVSFTPEANGPGFWSVVKHRDVQLVLRDFATFSSAAGGTNIRSLEPQHLEAARAILNNIDPPKHAKLRRIVQPFFSARAIDALAPWVTRLAQSLIDRAVARGSCEFVEEVAAELPMQVICELVGVPEADRRELRSLSDRVLGFDDPDYQQSEADGEKAYGEILLYGYRLASACGPNTVTHALVHAEVDGERLSDLEYGWFFVLLVMAGNETTRTAAAHGLRLLIEHPKVLARLRAQPELVPAAIEEILRLEPPVLSLRRTATCDVQIGGASIRAGDKVVVWLPSANRDEDVFAEGDVFDLDRPHRRELSFGAGCHLCLGIDLARLELCLLFEHIVQRMHRARLVGGVRRLRSNFINGVKEMRIQIEPS